MRAALFAVIICFHPLLVAQVGNKLTYDVSTVKPNAQAFNASFSASKGEFRATNYDLRALIAESWGLRRDQVVSGPAWVDNEHWDITAKVTESSSDVLKGLSKEQTRAMNQALLADRFHLRVHFETRPGLIYNLVPVKSGLRFHLLLNPELGSRNADPASKDNFQENWSSEAITWTARGINTKALISSIAEDLQQTVVDRTGLPPEARFDLHLRFTPEDDASSSTHSDAPPLRTALEEQLGLRLESAHGPVQALVVDHVERPSAN